MKYFERIRNEHLRLLILMYSLVCNFVDELEYDQVQMFVHNIHMESVGFLKLHMQHYSYHPTYNYPHLESEKNISVIFRYLNEQEN